MEDNNQQPVKRQKAVADKEKKATASKKKSTESAAKRERKVNQLSNPGISDTTALLWQKIESLGADEKKPVIADDEKDEDKNPAVEANLKSTLPKQKQKTVIHDQETGSRELDDAEEEDEEEDTEEVFESYEGFSVEDLVRELEELVKTDDISKVKTKIALIKVAFLKIQKEEQEKVKEIHISSEGIKDDISPPVNEHFNRFQAAFEIYKTKKALFNHEQESIKQRNLEEKQKILEELKDLINSEETLKKTYDDFKTLQERWREIGQVPKSEVNTLWQSYHFLVEKFFDKVKINKELKDLDLKKNLEAKIRLCEKAEELLIESSIIKSFKQLQKYHNEWKEIGPVPQDKKDEVWERFKNATDKINQLRREHYEKLQGDQEQNLKAKTALCDKAEAIISREITSVKDWQKATDQINELLNIWKSVGRTTKETNDEIWERFKTYLDTFYANKKEYYVSLKEQQVENYNLKLDLCLMAEAMKTRTNWKKTTEDMIRLQQDWKKIGPVPRKHSDKIWKRFRSACDEFFQAKASYYANIQDHEAENLKRKKELVQKVETFEFTGDKSQNLDILKEFQREWMEIGHVPINEKEQIQSQFRKAINKHLDRLKISSVEISTLNYKTKIESIQENPGANRVMAKERNVIINKIIKLKEDIHLWENNIGFLADSKKANILKLEFEKKIQQSKDELVILEAKLKFLNEIRDRD